MIGRGSESNRTVAATTSRFSRAAASVSPTEAYSGSVKLPIGLSLGRQDRGRPEDGVGRGHQSLADRLVHNQRAPGDIAGREDVRRGRAQVRVHLDVPAPVGLNAGPVEVQPGGGRDPSGRDHGERGVDAVLPVAGRMGEPHAGRTALEAVDRPGVLDDLDAGRGQGGADGFGDLMVLGHQDAGGDLNEMDP